MRSGVLRAIGVAITVPLNLLIAAWLSPGEFGQYAFMIGLFNLAVAAAVFGSDLLLARKADLMRRNHGATPAYVAAQLRGAALRTLPAAAALFLAVEVLWPDRLLSVSSALLLWIGVLIYAWLYVTSAAHRARGDAVAGALALFVVRPAIMLALVLGAATVTELTVSLAVAAFVLSGAMALTVAGRAMVFVRALRVRHDAREPDTLALGSSTLCAAVLLRVDHLVLPTLLTPVQFGIYALARYVLDGINQIAQLIFVQLGPEMVVAFRRGGARALAPQYFAAVAFGCVVSGGALIGWLVFGTRAIESATAFPVHPTYTAVTAVLAWAAVAALLGPVFLAYKMLADARAVFLAHLVVGAVGAAAYPILTSLFGLRGAIAALIVASAAPVAIGSAAILRQRVARAPGPAPARAGRSL